MTFSEKVNFIIFENKEKSVGNINISNKIIHLLRKYEILFQNMIFGEIETKNEKSMRPEAQDW